MKIKNSQPFEPGCNFSLKRPFQPFPVPYVPDKIPDRISFRGKELRHVKLIELVPAEHNYFFGAVML